MLSKIAPFTAAVFLACLPAQSFAQQGGNQMGSQQMSEEQRACQDDAFEFCQEAMPEEHKVYLCLRSHRKELTAACRAMVAHPWQPGRRSHGGASRQ